MNELLVTHDQIKNAIKEKINSVCNDYVSIGYYLNLVQVKEMYKDGGYAGIGDYAASEYGISKDRASWLMKVADKFCKKDSPVLEEQYMGFSISKLREMVYLTDEQLEQVDEKTTVKQVREIRNPKKKEPAFMPWEVRTMLADTLCKMYKFPFEKYRYSMAIIQEMLNKNHSEFGTGTDERGKAKYSANSKDGIFYLLDENDIPVYKVDAMEIGTLIYNQQGRDWHNANPVEQEQSKGYESSCPPGIGQCIRQEWGCTPEQQAEGRQECKKCWKDYEKRHKFDGKPPIEHVEGEIVTPNAPKETTIEIPDHEDTPIKDATEEVEKGTCPPCAEDCKRTGSESQEEGESICLKCWSDYLYGNYSPDSVTEEVATSQPENIGMNPPKSEAEPMVNIETPPEEYDFDAVCEYDLIDIEKEIDTNESRLKIAGREKMTMHVVSKYKMLSDALKLLKSKLLSRDVEEQEDDELQEQQNLPDMRNKYQRSEFIDTYRDWPLWIEQKQTNERYYRFNFESGDAFVVKEYLVSIPAWLRKNGMETETEKYGNIEYYLLKPDKHFKDCQTNKSTLIDYLKDMRKNGQE